MILLDAVGCTRVCMKVPLSQENNDRGTDARNADMYLMCKNKFFPNDGQLGFKLCESEKLVLILVTDIGD